MLRVPPPIGAFAGPPGTGKTRTISVALEKWARCGEPAWVIAQSNVGVKNIAENLAKREIDFKLIVSHDFYYDWCAFHALISHGPYPDEHGP